MELTRWQRWRLLAFRLFAVRADRLNHTPTRHLYAPALPGTTSGEDELLRDDPLRCEFRLCLIPY